MTKQLYQITLIVLFSIVSSSVYTQTFYKESIEAGKDALDTSDYKTAILNFTAAVSRSASIKERDVANEMRNTAFKLQALELEEERNKATQAATKATQAATKATEEAAKATLEKIKAKASLLALQSKQALEDHKSEEALRLAFGAVDTLNAANIPLMTEVVRSLGDAVRENRTTSHSFGASNIFQATFTTASKVVVADRKLKQLTLLNAQDSVPIATHQDYILDFDISKDGQSIASASKDGLIQLDGKKEYDFKETTHLIEFSHDAQSILAAAKNQRMVLLQNGQIIEFDSLTARPLALDFAPNDQQAFVRMNDGSVQLLDIANKMLSSRIQYPNAAIHHAQYTSDGNFLITTDYNNVVIYTSEGEKKTTIAAKGRLKPAIISDDGKLIAIQNHQGETTFWKIDGRESSELNKSIENKTIEHIIFATTTDDILIATSTDIRIVNRNGEVIHTLEKMLPFHQLKYAADEQHILTVSKTNTVQIWNLEGEEVLTLHQHTAPILDAQFSSTSTHVMTYGEDGEVNICPLPSFVLAKR